MSDIQEQLAELRKRIASVERRFREKPAPPRPPQPEPRLEPGKLGSQFFVEEWLSGEEVRTRAGAHFETTRLYERHRRHGSFDLTTFEGLQAGLFAPFETPPVPPERWCFLDTETTGLAGGSGTYAFLIGVGRFSPRGFEVRQFFLRDFGEEPSALVALRDHLSEFDLMVTYNGKTYDQPLLETRYRLSRETPPFTRLGHLDLLHACRRLWKLRFDSCRLVDLEREVLGVEREGDLPGEMIPYVYFEYLRKREAFRLQSVLHHNANDILTLACLSAIVPLAFTDPEQAPLTHGTEFLGIARWLRAAEREEEAVRLFRHALKFGLPDALAFRALWDVAAIEKRLGRTDAAIAGWTELAGCRNEFRAQAYEELAKHYEHRERNYELALEFTRAARADCDTDELQRREARLVRRLSKPVSRRLL